MITSLAFILTLESPDRFDKSRAVGPHLGLTSRQDQSGSCDKKLRISKEGDVYLRRLLVSCACLPAEAIKEIVTEFAASQDVP